MPVAELTSVQGKAFNSVLEAAAEPTAMERSKACKAANQSYQDFRHSWKRLDNLVYVLCVAAVLFLVGAIVLFAASSDTHAAGIVSFVGTVVTGIGAKFVVDERNAAKKDKLDAARIVKEYCDDAPSKLDPKDLQAVT